MTDDLPVVLICGSVRRPSCTRALVERAAGALADKGMQTSLWDLGDRPLPIADPDYHRDPAAHPDPVVRQLVALTQGAAAIVLASPIYHNSCSGVLKNALDHLAIQQFYYKPVGLLSHGGNRSPQAVDALRTVVRGLLGVALPTQVCTAQSDYAQPAPDHYELASAEVAQRLDRFALELLAFAVQLRPLRRAD